MTLFQRETPGPQTRALHNPPSATTPNKAEFTGQAARVLAMLRDADAVCSVTFVQSFIPRAASVIHRLRRRGYVISTRPCSRSYHEHQTPQIEYRLEALGDA